MKHPLLRHFSSRSIRSRPRMPGCSRTRKLAVCGGVTQPNASRRDVGAVVASGPQLTLSDQVVQIRRPAFCLNKSERSPIVKKPLVYLAAPYSQGDPAINTRCQVRTFIRLLQDGVVTPLAPLLSHLPHLMYPQPYETWMRLSFEELEHCDACLCQYAEFKPLDYLQKASSGMQREIEFCDEHGIPVFDSFSKLYDWAHARKGSQ
jgi:hypothetical protein